MGNRAEGPERETESSRLEEQEKDHWVKLEVAWVWKWPLVKLNTSVFLSIQINRTNKLSIQKGRLQILHLIWHLNIRSHNAMLCRTIELVQNKLFILMF